MITNAPRPAISTSKESGASGSILHIHLCIYNFDGMCAMFSRRRGPHLAANFSIMLLMEQAYFFVIQYVTTAASVHIPYCPSEITLAALLFLESRTVVLSEPFVFFDTLLIFLVGISFYDVVLTLICGLYEIVKTVCTMYF